MNEKPCIECGKDCDILPLQLGDSFTLTYLRVCGADCMLMVVYDYLHQMGYHREFRHHLYDKQNEEDKRLRDAFLNLTTSAFLESFKEHLQLNPHMLSQPVPDGLMKMFVDITFPPSTPPAAMRFSRPKQEDRIKWAKEHVANVSERLKEAILDLERLENDADKNK